MVNFNPKLLVLLSVLAVIQSIALYSLVTYRKLPFNYLRIQDGNFLLNDSPVPFTSVTALLNWATETATELNTYDFLSPQENLYNIRNRFSRESFDTVMNLMQKNFNIAQSKRLIVKSIPFGEATQSTRLMNDVRVYKISIPILLNASSGGSDSVNTKYLVSMLVSLVNEKNNPLGYEIIKYDQYQLGD